MSSLARNLVRQRRVSWRFLEEHSLPPPQSSLCRVVLAGSHFMAAGNLLSQALTARNQTNVELIQAPTREELLHWAPLADVALPFMERFDAEFLTRATRLRLVQQFGVGLEGVDMDMATQLGIAVANIPAADTGNAQATAEHAVWLTLSLLRQTQTALPQRFERQELGGLPLPRALFRKRVTVVGYGAVGQQVCTYLQVMGAHVTAVRRQWPEHDNDDNNGNNNYHLENNLVRAVSLPDVLPTTDILILACSLTPETQFLINHDTLALLPSTAIVVNIGRGPLVHYTALRQALEQGTLAGFASDVGVGGHPANKPSEPWDPNDYVSQHERTLFTPHVGGYTDYSYGTMVESVVDAIQAIGQGQPPPVWVNRADDYLDDNQCQAGKP